MNKLICNVIIGLVFFSFSGCFSKHDIKLEQSIYNNIFDELIDSTIIDYRKISAPSPSDFESIRRMENLNKRIVDNKQKQVSTLFIYVNDTIKKITEVNRIHKKIKTQLSNQDYQAVTNNSLNQTKESSTIKLQNLIVNTSKYELKHYSIKIEDKKLLKGSEKDRISGTYHLSRIHFNKEKTLGFLTLGVVHGRLNAVGVIVIIKKEGEKWRIKKIIEDWNS